MSYALLSLSIHTPGLCSPTQTGIPWQPFEYQSPFSVLVRSGKRKGWHHEPGSEYLAARPTEVPGLRSWLATCNRKQSRLTLGREWNVNDGAFRWRYREPFESYDTTHHMPPPSHSTASLEALDPFQALPRELFDLIIDNCSSQDIANLRLVTRACRQLPIILFRRLLLQEMPWLWEARGLSVRNTHWWLLYQKVKFSWANVNGLKNRKRIWKAMEEIVRRIQRNRSEGLIKDGQVTMSDSLDQPRQ